MKVSVIVPAYNTEPYIEKCLDSILSQTLADIEVIVAVQKSDDKTLETVLKIKESDERIKVIHCYDIRCTGTARNLAITAAKGEYLCFIDSDDYIESDMIETLYSALREGNADIAYCDFYMEDFNDDRIKVHRKIHKNIIDADPVSETERLYEVFCNPEAANKMYRKSLIAENSIFFPNTTVSEDLVFVIATTLCAKNIKYIEKPFYHYILNRPGSTSTNPKICIVNECQNAIKLAIDYYRTKDADGLYKTPIEAAIAKYSLDHLIRYFYIKRITDESPYEFEMFINENIVNLDDIRGNVLYESNLKLTFLQKAMYEQFYVGAEQFRNRKNIIFSASNGGRNMLNVMASFGLATDFFSDNSRDKQGKELEGIRIIKPQEIMSIGDCNVIIAADVKYYDEIRAQLEELGVDSIHP